MEEKEYKTIIKYDKEPYIKGEEVFQENEFGFNPGRVTVLAGPNGSGKSTLLNIIEKHLKDNNIKYVSYNNVEESKNAIDRYGYFEDFTAVSILISSSEGQCLFYNIARFTQKISNALHGKAKDDKEFWILMDATDSGLSIDKIIDVKEQLFKTVLQDNPNKDIYIVIAANSYEYTVPMDGLPLECRDVKTGAVVKFDNYDDYRYWICLRQFIVV